MARSRPSFIETRRGVRIRVDSTDHAWLSQWRWYVGRSGYAQRAVRVGGRTVIIYMHREVLQRALGRSLVWPQELVDHINRDALDNRRANLRVATYSQNTQNQRKQRRCRGRAPSSRFRGVSWHSDNQNWVAHIMMDGRTVFLGAYEVEEAAALAYDRAARRHHGQFASLNFTRGTTPRLPASALERRRNLGGHETKRRRKSPTSSRSD